MHLRVFAAEGPCQHRLRHPTTAARGVCGCTCGTHGPHIFSCHAGGYLIARHNHLRDLRSRRIEDFTGYSTPTQQNTGVADDARRPDLAFQTLRGETRWVDVAVVSPFARGRGDPRHTRAGTSVGFMEGVKRRKHAALALVPAVCSQFGRPCRDLIALFRCMGRDADLVDRAGVVVSLWQDWSSTLQKWNCDALAPAAELTPS